MTKMMAKYRAQQKAEAKAKAAANLAFLKANPVPGVKLIASDFNWPGPKQDLSFEESQSLPESFRHRSFELWFCKGFGWCVPTLHIRNASRRAPHGTTRRTYAVRIATGQLVRIGMGPHVEKIVTVLLSKKNVERLRSSLFEKVEQGEIDANVSRDRRSSRAALSSLRTRGFY